jgi:putative CocE/NonD family hydrolase
MKRDWASAVLVVGLALPAAAKDVVERDVAVPMRDGVVLRADVLRPEGTGPFPVLVYRTPYGKTPAQSEYNTFAKAVARGYAVVVQDVRGRYASAGDFSAYTNEGKDGFDTIEWAATQPWSNGDVGTFGLSYPGAVQWLAALESPPHLKAMAPAMTFATPRNFFLSGGVFDLSWISWIWSISGDTRARKNLPGPRTEEEVDAAWAKNNMELRSRLPLNDLVELREVAPYFFEWMKHPAADPWWDWAEIRGRYDRVSAAVLNISGWHDEAYGPDGAITNFRGLLESRKGQADPCTRLVMGPWVHGVGATASRKSGDRVFGPAAAIDYDELVLRFMDHYLRGIDNGLDREKRVRAFVMGENAWHEGDGWPLARVEPRTYYLSREAGVGRLVADAAAGRGERSSFLSDPAKPVTDPFAQRVGAHDYRALAKQAGTATFETEPLSADMSVLGAIEAELRVSVDAPDTDLWVKVHDVAPDGTAWNLMSPGLDVVRASTRDGRLEPSLLKPGEIVTLRFSNLYTGNRFLKGHRLRIVLTPEFFPHFSRNLHTGLSETVSKEMRTATITIHHDAANPSRLVLPVVP